MAKQILKFNGCCTCDAQPLDLKQLHFHHIGPKDLDPAACRGLGALFAELEQCCVVCEDCHKNIETGALIVADHLRISQEDLDAVARYISYNYQPTDLDDIPF